MDPDPIRQIARCGTSISLRLNSQSSSVCMDPDLMRGIAHCGEGAHVLTSGHSA
jgi:hypothetical protein